MDKQQMDAAASEVSPSRRQFIRDSGVLAASSAIAAAGPTVSRAAQTTQVDVPEKKELRVGFIPLTDCAPVVIAATEGFDRKYGIKITPVKETSWAAVRDKLITGQLDAAHSLYGLIYGLQMGIGGLRRDMAVLMTLNRNGQGITLSSQLRARGAIDGTALKSLVARREREYVFAQTFPTGNHAMWLYYWLGAHGIDPLRDVKTITVPPQKMAESLRSGRIDGCCVGEPWNAYAIRDGAGFTVATSQQVWPDHPEKVLGATADFVERNPNSARAMVMAVLDAARFIDIDANRADVARTIADSAFVDADIEVIENRFRGIYDDGRGNTWKDPRAVTFFGEGEVTFPWLSDGMWFLTQHRRWGMLKADPDFVGIARKVNRIDLYSQAAAQLGVALPTDPMRTSVLMDGAVWDGCEPSRYSGSFHIRAA